MTRFIDLRIFLAVTVVLVASTRCALAQLPAGDAELNLGYKALAEKDYDSAINLFRKALLQQPSNAGAHKDLAYTLLKAGENADARDEFEAALHLNEHDETAALEFAFLAFETKKPIEARRMFDRLRHSANAATRNTAERAFQNIDQPLADGIARWKEALARSANPNELSTFSAHWELAQLAELRDDLPLAAEQYQICRTLKPQLGELLLILARVWQQLNRVDEANAALLAASRSTDSRTAELALEHLPPRYPYPYEFVSSIKLDPQNTTLRRELAFLYLAMHQDSDAAEQFHQVLVIDPSDRLAREQLDAMHGFKKRPEAAAGPAKAAGVAQSVDAKEMGKKSLALGYTRDAIKYLRQAHEQSPHDAEVMLKLGLAYNLAKDDKAALPYLNMARRADDKNIAAQATKAYHTLNGDPVAQTTLWAAPVYSTRWKDVSTYGQAKRTIPLPWLGETNKLLSLYISTRFDLDSKGKIQTVYGPGYLSETAFITAVGVSSKQWHHFTAWGEAGEAVKYLPGARDFLTPDYRGGLDFVKGFGGLLGSGNWGLFYETTDDAVYVSRFDKDWLFYSQHRVGRTFQAWGHTSAQISLNANYSRDLKSEYWANSVETGPGLKAHLQWMPKNLFWTTDFLLGFYLAGPQIDKDYQQHYRYTDLRLGFSYAVTK